MNICIQNILLLTLDKETEVEWPLQYGMLGIPPPFYLIIQSH